MSRLRWAVPMVTAVLVTMFACESKPPPVVDGDYIVPKDVDVVEVCKHFFSGKRAPDRDCENNREGHGWMYDLRAGHSELPAVGETVHSSEFSSNRSAGLTIKRIPERGGWWK